MTTYEKRIRIAARFLLADPEPNALRNRLMGVIGANLPADTAGDWHLIRAICEEYGEACAVYYHDVWARACGQVPLWMRLAKAESAAKDEAEDLPF